MYVERTFRHVAEQRRLDFAIDIEPGLPGAMQTDAQRLQQVLKNLLSNSFKFTEEGAVSLRVYPAQSGWSRENATLSAARGVVAFESRTAASDRQIEAAVISRLPQASASPRKYSGTGSFGISGSARLCAASCGSPQRPGEGSTFVLYVPQTQGTPGRRFKGPHAVGVTAPVRALPPAASANTDAPATPADGPGAEARPPTEPVTEEDFDDEPAEAEGFADDRENIQPGDR